MGCIARLGCLVILLIAGIAGYLTRGLWLDKVMNRTASSAESRPATWEPLTAQDARSAQQSVESLGRTNGPQYVNLTGAELGSFVWRAITGRAPEPSDSVEAMVRDDQVLVRANVRLRELGIAQQLGPLAAVLGDRERLELGGTLRVLRAGLAEFDVRSLQAGSLRVPAAAIPKLVPRLSSLPRPEGMSPTGVPVRTPPGVGDVRVARGYVTLYRSTAPGGTP